MTRCLIYDSYIVIRKEVKIMNKLTKILATTGTMLALVSSAAFATPIEKTEGFICPVLGGQAGEHGSADVIITPPGGFNTIIGPNVSVPVFATNDNGEGSSVGPFVSPGDDGYTAIWAN